MLSVQFIGEESMTYNWCHGPHCHQQSTQSRVRGSGDNKVLRTIKIKQDSEYLRESVFSHFCNQRCLMDFIRLHKDRIVALAPRSEALETRIKVEKEQLKDYYNNPYTRKRITTVDNA